MSQHADHPVLMAVATSVLVAAAAVAFSGKASAIPTERTSVPTTPRVAASVPGDLVAVSADSSTDAWAVGGHLIEHWNGSTWKAVTHPAGSLASVVAVSPTDAWAVGGSGKTLIEHWDGTSWSTQSVRGVALNQVTESFAAVSANGPDDVWAVGTQIEFNPEDTAPISAHWDGTSWTQVDVPNPLSQFGRYGGALSGVTAISPNDAWAVGGRGKHASGKTFTVHWDGTAWKQVKSLDPNGRDGQALEAASATSTDDVWAVGHLGQVLSRKDSLVEHWDGTKWSQVDVPTGKEFWGLGSVSMTSPSNGWVVSGDDVVEQWDGSSWNVVSTPHVGRFAGLHAVAATSRADAWLVGNNVGNALVEHWNGHAWSVVQF